LVTYVISLEQIVIDTPFAYGPARLATAVSADHHPLVGEDV